MQVNINTRFQKQLKKLNNNQLNISTANFINMLQNISHIDEMLNIKKLTGHANAYRYRIGDYRIGFFFENSTIFLEAISHRKDIYKKFP